MRATWTRAWRRWTEGFELYGALDTPPVFWTGLLAIRASACLRAGRLDEAERYLDEATASLWEGDPTEAELEIMRGDLHLARADADAATAAFERAVTVSELREARMSHLQALTRLVALTDSPEARDRLRRALDLVTEGFDTPVVAEAAAALGARALSRRVGVRSTSWPAKSTISGRSVPVTTVTA